MQCQNWQLLNEWEEAKRKMQNNQTHNLSIKILLRNFIYENSIFHEGHSFFILLAFEVQK